MIHVVCMVGCTHIIYMRMEINEMVMLSITVRRKFQSNSSVYSGAYMYLLDIVIICYHFDVYFLLVLRLHGINLEL